MKRLTAPFCFFRQALKLRGTDVIVCTHELLFAAFILKIVTDCRVFYDVQENYFRNILFTASFPRLFRLPLALHVRIKEIILAPVVDHFFLAENCYQHELSFTRKKFTVLENKYQGDVTVIRKRKNHEGKKLLFSGTLSELTGVFTAIDLASRLHALDPSVTLTIIGYAPRPEEYLRIKRAIDSKAFITLLGGDVIVSHNDIVAAIQSAGFGIIAYPPSPSTSDRVPTKLYEYLANQLPILLIGNPLWVQMCLPYPAAIPFDPDHPDPAALLRSMDSIDFYSSVPQNVTWSSEEPRLLSLF